MKKIKFCSECGDKIIFEKVNSFNSYTAKHNYKPRCINMNCDIGKYFKCNHNLNLFGKCKNCGITPNLIYNLVNVAEWTILHTNY